MLLGSHRFDSGTGRFIRPNRWCSFSPRGVGRLTSSCPRRVLLFARGHVRSTHVPVHKARPVPVGDAAWSGGCSTAPSWVVERQGVVPVPPQAVHRRYMERSSLPVPPQRVQRSVSWRQRPVQKHTGLLQAGMACNAGFCTSVTIPRTHRRVW